MLQVLPKHISNLIAAGEVVQRPASVVKELMENAIDAGASKVSVIIDNAGSTLIQVIDNGCGMNPEEAKLCFARHATSKISQADDLHSILSYGFRGEALASIASVAQISLKTRERGSETGSETTFAESNFISQNEVSCPEGTNISVRNLFYNVPARRKFLKSEAAEFRHIVTEFSRVALCHPEVDLNLSHNKKDIFYLKATRALKQRIIEIAGKEFIKELVDINVSTSLVTLSGFIGTPEDARKSLGNQYFFVNGRFFKSPYLHKAVTKAYDKLIQEGYTPSYFIFFDVDPGAVDVNIHPAKIEVKFSDESSLFEILNAATREALGMNSFVPSIDFDTEGVPEIPPLPHKGLYTPPPKIDFDPLFNPFETKNDRLEKVYHCQTVKLDGYGEFFDEKQTKTDDILQLRGKFLITTVKSGLLLINIPRARERILYEKYLKALDNNTPIVQETLFAHTLDLDSKSYSILMEDDQRLKMLGFDIRPFGSSSVVIYGLPDGYASDEQSTKKCIDELIATLSENEPDILMKADGRSKMARSMARSGARGSNTTLSIIEAQLLVDTLFACSEPERTPDGRTCMTIISIDELEQRL